MTKKIQLHTERLLIRPIRLDDAKAIFEYRSDAKVNQYQGWIPKTLMDVDGFIINRVSSTIDMIGTWFQFVIIKKENNELIGDIGLHFFDSDKSQVEIGCTLNKTQHKKGYATEALRAIGNYVFHDLHKHRMIASIDPRNQASIQLFERLGFRKEAHFKKSLLINGEWVDDLIYAVLKDEWYNNKK